jgi:hypothetical protein
MNSGGSERATPPTPSNGSTAPIATHARPIEPLHTREVAGSKPAAPIVRNQRLAGTSPRSARLDRSSRALARPAFSFPGLAWRHMIGSATAALSDTRAVAGSNLAAPIVVHKVPLGAGTDMERAAATAWLPRLHSCRSDAGADRVLADAGISSGAPVSQVVTQMRLPPGSGTGPLRGVARTGRGMSGPLRCRGGSCVAGSRSGRRHW